jgi:hypothetical protein
VIPDQAAELLLPLVEGSSYLLSSLKVDSTLPDHLFQKLWKQASAGGKKGKKGKKKKK